MKVIENALLVEITYQDKKATLSFLDEERGEIREVSFNKQAYKDGKFVDYPEKAEKVENWCKELFGLSFDTLYLAEGERKTVYVYDKFNSLFEIEQIAKFDASQKDEIYNTEVKEIIVDDYFIKIRYEIDGKTYESKMGYGKYVKAMNSWFVDPDKKVTQFKKFEEKFGVPVEEKDKLIGHPLIVEVKSAFGNSFYGDIKKFAKSK